MSRSKKDSKGGHKAHGWGKEYWKSRLHIGGESLGRFVKAITHRRERRLGRKALADVENVRKIEKDSSQ